MSVLDYDQFDLISLHKDGYVVLTISDHLPWDDEDEHLLALQTKINNYLEGIESGQLVDQYPGAIEKKIVIQLIARYRPNEVGYGFLRTAHKTLRSAGYGLNLGFIIDGQIVVEEID